MNPSLILDIVLVLVILGRAAAGWHAGAALSLFRLAGMVLGGLGGLWLGPRLVDLVPALDAGPLPRTLVLLFAALIGVAAGEMVFGMVGRRVRSGLSRHDATRGLDAALGAVASAVVVSLVIWFVGAAVRPLLPALWGKVANQSRVLGGIDAAVPDSLNTWPSQLTDALSVGLPRVFGGLTPEPFLPAPAPDVGAAQTAGVKAAAPSVFQVFAGGASCAGDAVGSGWAVAKGRVVTNAHVVAGADSVAVRSAAGGPRRSAKVVAFDPKLDLAILSVPGLDAAPLRRAGVQPAKGDAVAAGFPLGGPYKVSPARIRGVVSAPGEDIYGRTRVVREVYSINATVRPGNSGGPLLTRDGRVAGTVFAASLVDANVGYVLTDAASDTVLDRAASYTTPVDTGGCLRR